MLGLLKLFFGLACLAAFAWWGLTVPLGERTLFGHLQAIGQSKESQELVRGTKQKVGDLTKRLQDDDQDEDQADNRGEGQGDDNAGAKKSTDPKRPPKADEKPKDCKMYPQDPRCKDESKN